MSTLTHIDEERNQPAMVDVGAKCFTRREATAACTLTLPSALQQLLVADHEEIHGPKGPVFATAIVAGTMAVKRTSDLIPFCHPLPIDACTINITPSADRTCLHIHCTVRAHYKTGVEMEALTGASITALCVFDMCKAVSSQITIDNLRVLNKTGGKSDILKETQ